MGNITVKTPQARFKGRVIVRVTNGYAVGNKVYKTFEAATDSIK